MGAWNKFLDFDIVELGVDKAGPDISVRPTMLCDEEDRTAFHLLLLRFHVDLLKKSCGVCHFACSRRCFTADDNPSYL